MLDLEGKRVWVAGASGMVGSALVRRLRDEDCEILTPSRSELDLADGAAVSSWVSAHRPDVVFLAAARVGGIHANSSYPVDFLADNLSIALNTITAAHRADVKKLLFLGSSCVYPREAAQPMSEDLLLTGPLEPTNEWYAVAKIAGIKLCEAYRRQHQRDFVTVMPTNLYGPGDNYHPQDSHVPAALLRRFHEARQRGANEVVVWGTGSPRRDFMHVDDLADACVFIVRHYDGPGPVNIGSSRDISIADFARIVADVVGFEGTLEFDRARPDGAPRKLLDVSRLGALGWRPAIGLRDGLESTYRAFLASDAAAAGASC